MTPEPMEPAWFREAVRQRPEEKSMRIDSTDVRFRCYGGAGAPPLVLVHGGAANSRWWDHVAPELAADRRVVALDLSGHGDSGHRKRYSIDQWATEVAAVARDAEDAPRHRAVVVGHSLGGVIALRAAQQLGAELAGLVVVDVAPERSAAGAPRRPVTPHRTYRTRAAAVSRFQPRPYCAAPLPYVMRYIAERSIRRGVAGWTWKFDPGIYGRTPACHDLAAIVSPTALVRAQHGLMGAEAARHVASGITGTVQHWVIPGASHHPMLDRPLHLLTVLQQVLGSLSEA